jgi:hypothetical protein
MFVFRVGYSQRKKAGPHGHAFSQVTLKITMKNANYFGLRITSQAQLMISPAGAPKESS